VTDKYRMRIRQWFVADKSKKRIGLTLTLMNPCVR